jgi:hypothetical protein
MASINASTSGAGGIITTADNTGNLNIQSAGSTVLALTSSGVAITGTLTATGTTFGNNTLKYVTDTTNITLVNIASSYVTVGSSFSVSIPATGYINVTSFAGRLTWSSVADNVGCVLGIRIGSTNYWFGKWSNNGTILYAGICGSRTSAGYDEWYGSLIKFVGTSANANDAAPLGLDIAANSIPTGTQTVQLIAAYGAIGFTGIGILSGATTTTRVGIEFVSAS